MDCSGFDLSRRFVCLQVCLQLRNYSIHTKPRLVEDKFFLALLDPFMVASDFRPLPLGLRHAQQFDAVQSDFIVSLSHQDFLVRNRDVTQLHQHKARAFVTGDRRQSKVFHLFEC